MSVLVRITLMTLEQLADLWDYSIFYLRKVFWQNKEKFIYGFDYIYADRKLLETLNIAVSKKVRKVILISETGIQKLKEILGLDNNVIEKVIVEGIEIGNTQNWQGKTQNPPDIGDTTTNDTSEFEKSKTQNWQGKTQNFDYNGNTTTYGVSEFEKSKTQSWKGKTQDLAVKNVSLVSEKDIVKDLAFWFLRAGRKIELEVWLTDHERVDIVEYTDQGAVGYEVKTNTVTINDYNQAKRYLATSKLNEIFIVAPAISEDVKKIIVSKLEPVFFQTINNLKAELAIEWKRKLIKRRGGGE